MSATVPAAPALPASGPHDRLRFGGLVQDGIDLLRRHFFALTIPLIILSIVTGSGQQPDEMRFDRESLALAENWMVLLPFFALLGVLALAIFIALFFVYSVVCVSTSSAALDAIEGRAVRPFGERIRDAWSRVLPTTGAFALALVFVVLGFVALVVPGFVVLAALYPLSAVIASERLGGMAAIRRAWALTRGRRWTLFGLMVATILAMAIGSAAVSWLPMVGRGLAGIVGGVGTAFLVATAALFYRRVSAAA